MALTPAALLARIRNMTGETDTYWTDGEVFAYISEAEQIATNRVPCNQDSTTVASVANQREYTTPANAKEIYRVTYNGQKLKNININELGALENTEADSSVVGDPRYYYIWGTEFGTSPVAGNDDTNFKLYYTTETGTDYSGTTPSFNTPSWLAHYYADFALYRMYAKDDELKKVAASYESRWERDLNEIETAWKNHVQGDQYTVVKQEGDVYPANMLGME